MNRRQYLGTAGTAFTTAALAGCVGSGNEGEDGVFVETAVNETALDVEFPEDSSIRQVNLLQDGELVNQASLQAGEYRTSIQLVQHDDTQIQGIYPPGDLTLVATDDAGEEYEHEQTIEPAMEIADVRVPDDDFQRLLVEVENTGNGPGALARLGVLGEELHEGFPLEDDAAGANFLQHPADESPWFDSHPLSARESIDIVPPDPVLGFVAITSYEPDPEPHWYDDPETLADELGGETIAVDVPILTATHNLTASVDVLLAGDVVERGRMHYFTEAQVDDIETSTKAL
ncbi:hypothetical protein [Saliphagus sp. LR7]|uniref:hypothetical protein n=1 Tax=Saliphagus sp. LR7 TaxID=2282654 RepID=UPI000DF82668|nr:hypothetical protein [Saliphagus sp. LR7]